MNRDVGAITGLSPDAEFGVRVVRIHCLAKLNPNRGSAVRDALGNEIDRLTTNGDDEKRLRKFMVGAFLNGNLADICGYAWAVVSQGLTHVSFPTDNEAIKSQG